MFHCLEHAIPLLVNVLIAFQHIHSSIHQLQQLSVLLYQLTIKELYNYTAS